MILNNWHCDLNMSLCGDNLTVLNVTLQRIRIGLACLTFLVYTRHSGVFISTFISHTYSYKHTYIYTNKGDTYSRGTSTIRWTRLDNSSSRRSWLPVSTQGVEGLIIWDKYGSSLLIIVSLCFFKLLQHQSLSLSFPSFIFHASYRGMAPREIS